MKRRDLLLAAGLSPLIPMRTRAGASPSHSATPAEAVRSDPSRLVAVAESLKPTLREALQAPLLLVRPVAAPSAALRWRMESDGSAEALADRVLKKGDVELVRSYWGGMVAAGADTFWEAYAPDEPLLSPYGDHHVNSYCHAWSCTPSYFIRSRGLV